MKTGGGGVKLCKSANPNEHDTLMQIREERPSCVHDGDIRHLETRFGYISWAVDIRHKVINGSR